MTHLTKPQRVWEIYSNMVFLKLGPTEGRSEKEEKMTLQNSSKLYRSTKWTREMSLVGF